MEYVYVEKQYVDSVPTNLECLLGVDIGGTNSNFGIFNVDNHNKLQLLISLHYKSQTFNDFIPIVCHVLSRVKKKYNMTIKKSCFAGAGVVCQTRDYIKLTNLPWAIDAKEILKSTELSCAYMVNDFEIIGYGIDYIEPNTLITVNKGMPHLRANRAIIGAGTGMGKCILVWNNRLKRYVSISSEGGHADAPVQSGVEYELIDFIRSSEGWQGNVSWEDLLSGKGIKRIHTFFKSRQASASFESPHPDEIFKSRHQDTVCMQTFELYTQLYARCAKNFALDALALNGMYIAGGIASKNMPMFQLPLFMEEFINCGKHQALLKNIPIYVITDYNVSLYGAAHYIFIAQMGD